MPRFFLFLLRHIRNDDRRYHCAKFLLELRASGFIVQLDSFSLAIYQPSFSQHFKMLRQCRFCERDWGLVKEWAYAGFFFDLTGASASHLFVKDPMPEPIVPLVLLAIGMASWYLRPASRCVTRDPHLAPK